MKKKNVGKALVLPLLAAAAFASIGVGTTFALFTSEAKAEVSVQAGKVSITAEYGELKTYSMGEEQAAGAFENGGTAEMKDGVVTVGNMTPGDKVEFTARFANASTVAIKYRLSASVSGEMEGALKVEVNGAEPASEWKSLEKGAALPEGDAEAKISIELPEDAGNEWQGKSASVAITMEAVQGNAEVHNPLEIDDKNKILAVYTQDAFFEANDMIGYGTKYNNHNTDWTFSLNTDLDLSGVTDWTGLGGSYEFSMNFDGNGHTIKGLKGEYGFIRNLGYKDTGAKDATDNTIHLNSSYSFKNVVFDSFHIVNKTQNFGGFGAGNCAGALANHCYGCDIENVTVQNSYIEANKYAGGLFGYNTSISNDGEKYRIDQLIKNCVVKDTTIHMRKYRAGGLVGFFNVPVSDATITVEGSSVFNVTLEMPNVTGTEAEQKGWIVGTNYNLTSKNNKVDGVLVDATNKVNGVDAFHLANDPTGAASKVTVVND